MTAQPSSRRSSPVVLLLAAASASLAAVSACNGLTGAGDLAVQGSGGNPSIPSGATSGGSVDCPLYFQAQDGACAPVDPGDPAAHTQADVCSNWTAGHVAPDATPLVADGVTCHAGTLKP